MKYGVEKCKKLHIGKENTNCPELRAHDTQIKNSASEKYLGEIITNSGKHRENFQARRDKGFGCVSEILSILKEIPLGRYKTHIALILRQAMLINGMLGSIEVWSDVKDSDIKLLEDVDEFFFRSIFKLHRKAPLKFLHLETGTVQSVS